MKLQKGPNNNPLLEQLKMELREELNKIPANTSKDPIILTLRTWKQKLVKLSRSDAIVLLGDMGKDENKNLLDVIRMSLDDTALTAILGIIQYEYANMIPAEKTLENSIAEYVKPGIPDDFTQKKQRIKNRLQGLYKDNKLDGKLIFGLGILLLYGDKNDEKYQKFSAGTFRSDVSKRLYTGDTKSFWEFVTNPISQKIQITRDKSTVISKIFSANTIMR